MSEAPRPPQRKITARIHTLSGWITGTFHVPEAMPFLEFLNETRDFFTLTEVRLKNQSRALDFLALQRRAALLIVPKSDEWAKEPPKVPSAVEERECQVSCLLEGGVLMGTLRLPQSLRVSDHLLATAGFIALRDCTVGLDEPKAVQAALVVIANAGRLVGVAEM